MKLKLLFPNSKLLNFALFFEFFLLFSVHTIFARDWYVDDNSATGNIYNLTAPFVAGNDTSPGDGTVAKPYATLSKAYTSASSGDIIYVDSGTYINGTKILFNKTNIQIIGAGAASTIFERSGTGTTNFGEVSANNMQFKGIQIKKYAATGVDAIAMAITAGTGIVLDQVIIFASVGSGGEGALYINQPTATLVSVTIKNSSLPFNRLGTALYGRAISINNATVAIDNCSFNDNISSGANGGAIFIVGATANVTITKCLFNNNEAASGGAIAHNGGTLTISNSCFDSNKSSNSLSGGGAILINHGTNSNVSLTNCTFLNNSTTAGSSDGGAITMTNSTGSITTSVLVSSCSFTNNSAADKGEDIYFDTFASLVHNITFKNNTFNTIYSGTQVNLHNVDFPAASIKFEGLTTAAGTGGNGDILTSTTLVGVPVSQPEMTGDYTESTTASPTSLPVTTCTDRFSGTEIAPFFYCVTTNTWGDVSTTATANANVLEFNKATNTSVALTAATWASSVITFTKTAHGLLANNYVTIEGFTPTAYNGYYKVVTVAANTFTVAKTTSPGTSSAMGTFTKGTPIGWTRNAIPTVDEHVIISYDYNTSTHGNIDACKMTIDSGKIVISDNDDKNTAGVDALGTYINVVNSITNNGTINIKTNGNLVQVNHPLDLNNETIVTPTINVNKITGNKIRWDYVYWGKPVVAASAVISNFTAFDLKYFWDPAFINTGAASLGWQTLTGEPAVGTGFITRVITAAGTTPTAINLTMSGVSNNGDITATVKNYGTATYKNYALLGNPYPGAINFQNFYTDNSSAIFGTVYLWTAKTNNSGPGNAYAQSDYASFNLTGGVTGATTQSPTGIIQPNGSIASGQGFMVKSKINGTVTFKNSHRTKASSGNSQFFKTGNLEKKDRFWIRITDSEYLFNEQLIGYLPRATSNFDEAYDGLINSVSKIKFFSLLGTKKLIIQGKGIFDVNDSVKIGYENKTNTNTELTISLSNVEGIFESGQKIYIHDKELEIYHNLNTAPYIFNGSENVFARFEIVYKLTTDVEPTQENPENDIIVYVKNNTLNIKADTTIKHITLYDVVGKVVLDREISILNNEYSINVNLNTGIYISKVTLSNNKTYTKKVIAQ